jgi:uncharacterized protein YndB with AHSA1/START domain
MNTASLQIRTALRIAKPAHEVYEAIVDPEKMKNYFISKSSGRMEEGKTIAWGFPEMDLTFPVQVKKTEPEKNVAFTWTNQNGNEMMVNIMLKPVNENTTFVVITEGEEGLNEKGIQWLKSNTEGWANFLACLKAWLEYGINLRKGAFDPSQMPTQEA